MAAPNCLLWQTVSVWKVKHTARLLVVLGAYALCCICNISHYHVLHILF